MGNLGKSCPIVTLAAVSALTLSAFSAAAEPLWPMEFSEKVREAGGSVSFVFRADRPFEQCHASTVAETEDGNLIAAWFGGSHEKNPDVAIWSSLHNGEKWSAPERVAKVNDTAHWNPVLFRDEDANIHLFFKVGPEIPHWQTYWMSSEDGKTWSEAKELVPGDSGGRGPVRNKPIILSDGTWLAGASTELNGWNAFGDWSTDGGKTWTRSEDIEFDKSKLSGKGIIQPTLWESEPGKVHTLMRSTGGVIMRADSEDGGKTWGPAYDSGMPNNNSGVDAVQLKDGRLLLVFNPSSGNWTSRNPIDLAVSEDNGKTWNTIAHLEADADLRSEFSYPAIIQKESGDVVITYTYQRERVRCWQIPLSAL